MTDGPDQRNDFVGRNRAAFPPHAAHEYKHDPMQKTHTAEALRDSALHALNGWKRINK